MTTPTPTGARRRRTRRPSSSIEQSGADLRLAELLDVRPKLTYDEIRAILASEGFDLSRSAIGRWSIAHEEAQRRVRETLRQARALRAASGAGAILQIEEATTTLLQTQLYEHLQEKRNVDKESLEIAHAISALGSAAAQRERVRIVREKAIRLAAARIKAEVRRELGGRPELVAQIAAIADGVEKNLVEQETRAA